MNIIQHIRKSNIRNTKGCVFNIQKFSIHDGPGIRTTVFLKGCPLRCWWCSNPESIHSKPEIITKFDVCRNCGRCVEVCKHGAISLTEDSSPFNKIKSKSQRTLNRKACNACLSCVDVCPSGALSSAGKDYSANEVLKIIKDDLPFYKNSGGGITISGGEPLYQPDFTLALLKSARKIGIHTALDTSGYADPKAVESILPYVNLFLYDIKHLDSSLHRKYTGVDNTLILNNLYRINGRVEIYLRVPLIPGINDGESHLEEIIALAGKLEIAKVYFMPYHRYGVGKYAGLGRKYLLPDAENIPPEKIEYISELCQSRHLTDYEFSSELFTR